MKETIINYLVATILCCPILIAIITYYLSVEELMWKQN